MKRASTTYQADEAQGEQLTLIDPPAFCPNWPARNTLAALALKRLLDGAADDHMDFLSTSGSWRLAAVIYELRELGWPIDTHDVPAPTKEKPDRVIALYRLPRKYAADALASRGGR